MARCGGRRDSAVILDIDRYSHINSSLQRWDPRYKILSIGVFIAMVAFIQTLPVAVMAFLVASAMVVLSRIPLHFVVNLLKWVVIFLLPFFIILPLSYPGMQNELLGIGYAWEGVRLACLVVIKGMTIVICAFAIFGTSRFDVAMFALQRLKCPRILVQLLLFTYRYIFVFLSEMERMDTAMKARGFVRRPNLYTLKVIGGFIGTLLIRSFERTERVFKAMLSKGYQGELHTLIKFHAVTKDYIKAVAMVVVASLLFWAEFSGQFHIAIRQWY